MGNPVAERESIAPLSDVEAFELSAERSRADFVHRARTMTSELRALADEVDREVAKLDGDEKALSVARRISAVVSEFLAGAFVDGLMDAAMNVDDARAKARSYEATQRGKPGPKPKLGRL